MKPCKHSVYDASNLCAVCMTEDLEILKREVRELKMIIERGRRRSRYSRVNTN